MAKILDVMTIHEINEALKQQGIAYTLHSAGGCSGDVLELRNHGKTISSKTLCEIINQLLKDRWIQVQPVVDGSYDIKVV